MQSEYFPPINIERYKASAIKVLNKYYLFGGKNSKYVYKIEVINVNGKEWEFINIK